MMNVNVKPAIKILFCNTRSQPMQPCQPLGMHLLNFWIENARADREGKSERNAVKSLLLGRATVEHPLNDDDDDEEPALPAKMTQNFMVTDLLSAGPEHHGVFHYTWDVIRGNNRWKKGLSYSDRIANILDANNTWQAKLSVICLKILFNIYGPMKALGHLLEDILNLFVANGGVFSTFYRMFFPLAWHKLVILDRQHADYKSFLALVDPRVQLYVTSAPSSEKIDQANAVVFPGTEYGSKFTADVLVMASKIAYENGNYIERCVGKYWKMNFVGFWDCWNGKDINCSCGQRCNDIHNFNLLHIVK
ncbi:hypothetical protein R1sor_024620 [Riccia sorocarpa]|uniref:Uncharacterized protein n=1 Tax=Riccia sorocarpa TaxID=122646 RepID=A0ABD3GX28_9MARC